LPYNRGLDQEVAMADLFSTLAQRFPDHAIVPAGDGELLVTVRGARVLACRMPGVDGNLFWHPPKLERQSDEIGGGDRLWIAPEVGWCWPSLDQARQDPIRFAAVPATMDPGSYTDAGRWPGGIHLDQSLELQDVRDGKRIGLQVRRVVAAIVPPHAVPAGVAVCSFGITNALTVTGGDEGAVAGAWDILQVPPTGTLICPTTQRPSVRSYYDPFGDRHVAVADDHVRFLIDGQRRIKMGLRPEHTTGRMGYFRPIDARRAALIVRVFPSLPGEQYPDIPRDHPANQRTDGDALQAYNDDGTYGGFGELEYHDPAVRVGGCETRTGQCVTHVLTGDAGAVVEAGRSLLGVAVEPI
jgi:hypothetical protein